MSKAAHAKVSRDDWLIASLGALVEGGVEQVKILPLAKGLGVARSSFYWHFTDRQALLDELLAVWKRKNTASVVSYSELPAASIQAAMLKVFEVWTDDALFDPRLEFAIRDWARRDDVVRIELAKADSTRIEALADMFSRYGFSPREALIRARVTYYTQLSYYDLVRGEPLEIRVENAPVYVEVFTGSPPTDADVAAFRRRSHGTASPLRVQA